MRGAVISLLATGLLLTGSLVGASGREPERTGRALATVYTAFGDPQGEAFNDVAGTTKRAQVRDYTDEDVSIGSGAATATVASDEGATASAVAEDLEILDGRVVVERAERTANMGAGGSVRYSGRVSGLQIDGTAYPTGRAPESFAAKGLEVVVNEGNTGLYVMTRDLDLRFAVARTSQTTVTPDPTPTPTPTPAPTNTPKPAPTPSPEGDEPSKAARRAAARARRERAATKRLAAGPFRFPVLGEAETADTFGAARAAPIVEHEGVDIFADFGTPVIAVADGRLFNVGTLEISGNRLWLETDDGDAFFYAHLSAFAPAAQEGARVRAGTVLGYTGNTGDAEPTPPHVHFEIHPGGEGNPAIDPYPIITSWAGATREQGNSAVRPGSLVTVRDFIAE